MERFQSTPSVWRETADLSGLAATADISIHSLRVEGDVYIMHEERKLAISIHSLRVEGDTHSSISRDKSVLISIHSLRVEGDALFVNV